MGEHRDPLEHWRFPRLKREQNEAKDEARESNLASVGRQGLNALLTRVEEQKELPVKSEGNSEHHDPLEHWRFPRPQREQNEAKDEASEGNLASVGRQGLSDLLEEAEEKPRVKSQGNSEHRDPLEHWRFPRAKRFISMAAGSRSTVAIIGMLAVGTSLAALIAKGVRVVACSREEADDGSAMEEGLTAALRAGDADDGSSTE